MVLLDFETTGCELGDFRPVEVRTGPSGGVDAVRSIKVVDSAEIEKSVFGL